MGVFTNEMLDKLYEGYYMEVGDRLGPRWSKQYLEDMYWTIGFVMGFIKSMKLVEFEDDDIP